MYTTISEISERADIVIIGNPVETMEVVNTARIPGDPEKPDPDHFSIGQIYEVLVDEYVKGSGDKKLFIIQHQGSMITNSSAPSIEEIEKARAEYKYIPLTSNKKYLMFLIYTTHSYKGYSHEKIFTAVGYPWLFELSNANCVQLADTLTELSNYFPAQSLPNFISQVNGSFGVDDLSNTPYPLPEGDSACIEEPVQPYP